MLDLQPQSVEGYWKFPYLAQGLLCLLPYESYKIQPLFNPKQVGEDGWLGVCKLLSNVANIQKEEKIFIILENQFKLLQGEIVVLPFP